VIAFGIAGKNNLSIIGSSLISMFFNGIKDLAVRALYLFEIIILKMQMPDFS